MIRASSTPRRIARRFDYRADPGYEDARGQGPKPEYFPPRKEFVEEPQREDEAQGVGGAVQAQI
jgi:hypothetical protein